MPRGSVCRPCLKLQMRAKHLYLGPQLTSQTQNSNLRITELEGATTPQIKKLRSRVWSQNIFYKPQFGDGKLCPKPHMPPVDVSLGSTGVMYVILASCYMLFELTEKLALGIRPHPTHFRPSVFVSVFPKASGLQMVGWLLLPDSVTGRRDSSPKEFKYCAFENSWKGTISNRGGYRCSM